ncbi:MAG TPA: hypothetical protein RMH99_04755 [Sandaracinaceae bacterium LLY-WYZ-13_1]|nr:hypothetical protein [Sandaracinaceae bacterium LLY-WYZ-13_1]
MTRSAILSFLVAGVLTGCDDGDANPDAGPRDGGRTADAAPGADGGPGDGGTADAGTVDLGYVVSAATFGPGGIDSYVGLVPSLGDDATLDPADAIEVPGVALLYVREGSGEFFVDSVSALTLTKYGVEGGRPVERGQLSFAGLGFPTTQRTSANVFASETRAYLIDSGTLQMVRWNPSEMTIDETVDLSELAGDVPALVYAPVVRDGTAFFPFAYYDPASDTIQAESVVLAVDLEDGSRTVLRDDRCGDAIYALLTESGDILLGSGTVNAATEYLGREGAGASCLRRIPAGALAFDEAFHPPIADFVEADHAGGLIAGPDGDVYVRALDASALPPEVATSAEAVAAPAWTWWRVDLDAGTATEAVDLGASAGRFTAFEVEGRTFATRSAADFSSTTLLETTVEPPAERLSVTGIVGALGRL